MDAAAHEIAGCSIDDAVPCHGVLAGESVGDDADAVMASLPGAGMAGVQVGVIFDLELLRLQGRQPLAQQGDGFAAHGRAFLKGLMVTFSYTPAAM